MAGLVLAYAESSTDPKAILLAIKIRVAFEFDLGEKGFELVTAEEVKNLPESTLTAKELMEEAVVVFDPDDLDDQGALDYFEALLASIGMNMLAIATKANNRSVVEIIDNIIEVPLVANTEAADELFAT